MGSSAAERESLSSRLHLFQHYGNHYALDGNDLSAYRLDRVTWQVLRALQRDRLGGPVRQVSGLSRSQVLTALAEARSEGLLKGRAPKEHPLPPRINAELSLVAADFHVTNDCNLRCRYCYGLNDAVRYVNDAGSMSSQTARAAIDFLVAHADKRRGFGLIFFGGEPLLNFGVIQETIRYGKMEFSRAEKPIHFSMTTNGTLLTDATIRFLNDHRVSIMISLDGPQNVQDLLRPTRSGGSTYDAMLPGVRTLLASRNGNVTSRATVCSANRDMVALNEHSRKLGFRRTVMCPESNVLDHQFKMDGASYALEYQRLATHVSETFIAGVPDLPTPFDQLLPMLLFRQPKYNPCGAARNYLAIAPSGDIYPCHRFMGDPEFKLGDITNGINRSHMRPFESLPRTCDACWARMICAGGCRHQHYIGRSKTGLVAPRQCRLVREVIEMTTHMCFDLEDRAGRCPSEWAEDLKTRVQASYQSSGA